MLLIGSPKRRRGIGALVIAVVLAALAGAATAHLTDGIPVSCQPCYDRYPTWVCVWVWGCPDPGDAGGGGGSGAQSTRPVR